MANSQIAGVDDIVAASRAFLDAPEGSEAEKQAAEAVRVHAGRPAGCGLYTERGLRNVADGSASADFVAEVEGHFKECTACMVALEKLRQ